MVLVTLEMARFEGCVGGVVSAAGGGGGGGGGGDCAGQADVEASSLASCDSFPAASRATIANAYEVPHVRPAWLDEVEATVAIRVPLR